MVCKRKTAMFVLAMLVSSVLWSACSQNAFSPPATPVSPKRAVKIGVVTSLVGPQAMVGKSNTEGFQLYFDENKYQIAGRKIDLVVEDDKFEVSLGMSKVTKLLESDQVDVLAGPINSALAQAMVDVVVEHKVPWIITQASVSEPTQAKHSPYTFRVSNAAEQPHLPMGPYIYQKLGYKKLVVLAMDYVAGKQQAEAFTKAFEAAGGKVVQTLLVPAQGGDMIPYIAKIDVKGADAVNALIWGKPAVDFFVQASELGLSNKIPVVSYAALEEEFTLEAIGKAAVGMVNYFPYALYLDIPANKAFVQSFESKYGRKPSYYAEQGYTAAKAIGEAMKAVGGNVEETSRFLEALGKVNFSAPRGPFRFDKYGNVVYTVYIRKVVEEKGVLKNAIIDSIPNVSQQWTPEKGINWRFEPWTPGQ